MAGKRRGQFSPIAQVVKDDHFAQLERIDLLGSIDVILGDGQITWQVGQMGGYP